MLRFCAVLVLAALANCQDTSAKPESKSGTYLITFAKKIAPGWMVPIRVEILKAQRPVTVEIALVNTTSGGVFNSMIQTFVMGSPREVEFQIPKTVQRPWKWNELRMNFTGTGGLTFTDSESISYNEKSRSIFIQTDKAIYKPGQTVKIRVVAVFPDLKLVKDPMDIVIYDSFKNRIKQWLGVTDSRGVIERMLTTSSDPVMGDWSIKVTLGTYTESKTFTIQEYVLPRFEVTLDAPSFLTTEMQSIPIKVISKYTHGRGVVGTALVQVRFSWYRGSWKKGHVSPTIERRVAVKNTDNGEGTIVVSKKELIDLLEQGDIYTNPKYKPARVNITLSYRSITVEANFTETLTGNTRSADKIDKTFHKNPNKMKFLTMCPSVFKPGLVYHCLLHVTEQDGTPVSPADVTKPVNVTITYQEPIPTTPAPPTTSTSTTTVTPDKIIKNGEPGTGKPLAPITMVDPGFGRPWFPNFPRYKTITLYSEIRRINPKTGFIEIKQALPKNANSINLKAEGFGANAYKYVSKAFSPSDNFIQLGLENAQTKVGQSVEFNLKSTEPISSFIVQVLARSRLVHTENVQVAIPTTPVTFSITMTAEMSPTPQIIAYYKRADGEVLADAISVKVEGTFDNKISLEWLPTKVKPGDNSILRIKGDADSVVFLLGVDKKVQLLKEGNDITADTVATELLSYDYGGYYPWFDNWFRVAVCWWPRYSSGTDAQSVFSDANLAVVTDANVYRHKYNGGGRFGGPVMMFQSESMKGVGMADGAGNGQLKENTRVRKFFPETWIWEAIVIGPSKQVEKTFPAPDGITAWVTSAFATHPVTGLAVAPRAANLTTELKMYMRLELPYSVIRGEEFVLQVTVFNHFNRGYGALITLKKSFDIDNVIITHLVTSNGQTKPHVQLYSTQYTRYVFIKANSGNAVFFVIKPKTIGKVKLELSMLTSGNIQVDAVSRELLVEPEGVERAEGSSILIDLKSTPTFQKSLSVEFPRNTVKDSQGLRISVAGDILGSSLDNMKNLVRMPYGCGEQNMINFAPLMYLIDYLNKTGRLTPKLEETIKGYMDKGYQRELKYKHREGCYSAFGDHSRWSRSPKPQCSMWLTTFVLKCFTQANAVLPGPHGVDDVLVMQGLQWAVDQQAPDGSFVENGKVFHKALQGGSGKGTALTAYTLIALLEAQKSTLEYSNKPLIVDVLNPLPPKGSENIRPPPPPPGSGPVPIDPSAPNIPEPIKPQKTTKVIPPLTEKKLSGAIAAAVAYLEQVVAAKKLTTNYNKIIVAYALTLANSARASEARAEVESNAKYGPNSKYWEDPSPPQKPGYIRYSWYRGTEAKNIEMTAYVLLTYAALNQKTAGLRVMTWLSNQRNDKGGFISTQDTVIALEALSKFAGLVYSPDTDMTVSVALGSFQKNYVINSKTDLLLQSDDVPYANVPGTLQINAAGKGVAVLNMLKKYNLESESTNPNFDLSLRVTEQTDTRFVLNVCFQYKATSASGMAILKINLLTGFAPDVKEKKHTIVYTRVEREGKMLTLYFDEIPTTQSCVFVVMNMVDTVLESQPGSVSLQDYYSPDDEVTRRYSQTSKPEMCTLCKECSYFCTKLNQLKPIP